jgi:GNAT superfamily N-acetyltransferase
VSGIDGVRLERVVRDGRGRMRWTAYVDGDRVVGSASVSARPQRDADDGYEAGFDLEVEWAYRRHGVGTALYEAVLCQATDAGASSVAVEVPTGGPGESFAAQRGFTRALALVYLRLDLDTVDGDVFAELADLGDRPYRLVFWSGAPPDDLVEAMAVARSAMSDAPMGELQRGAQAWDAAEVLRVARVVEDRGDRLHTVAALTEDGVIAGYTEIVVTGRDGPVAQQYDTVVVRDHRGHGLGVLLKARLARWARVELATLRSIETDNAQDNAHMIEVNRRLGYREVRRASWWRRGI